MNLQPFYKFLTWLFFSIFICFIGIFNVFAEEVDIGYITNKTTIYYENNDAQAMVSLPVQTNVNRYLYNLLSINISNQSIIANYTYLLEISTPNAKLQNINEVHIVDSSGNVCQFFGTSDFSIGYAKVYFKCNQATNNLTIGLNNTNPTTLTSSITTGNNFQWNYSYLRYFTEDDEIDLGPIISSQNQNTQDIINNQNSNTQQQIESQKVCKTIDKNYIEIDNKYLNSNGVQDNSPNYGITSFFKIDSDTELKVLTSLNSEAAKYCFYNVNKELISCHTISNSLVNTELSIPNNSEYFRSSIQKAQNKPTFQLCRNGNQALNDSINGLNDSINDDNTNGATSEASDFFSDFSTNTFGLTSIITAPLNLIQSLTSKTCTPLHLPLPYLNNKYLDLPCMSTIYSQHFGSFFTLYQTITYGIIAYWVCVRIFNHVKDFKNPEHDEIEVVDL